MANFSLAQAVRLYPPLRELPLEHLWIDYDHSADVLYVNLERPQRVTDSDMTSAGIIKRWRGKKLVGLTILNASKGRR